MAWYNSGWGIAGIIFLIIGIIMAVIGIVLLISRQSTTTSTEWYIWFLIIGGIVLGVIGGILIALALAYAPVVPVVPVAPVAPAYAPVPQCYPMHQVTQVAPQPVRYVQQPMVAAPTVQYVQQPVAAPSVQYVQQPVATPVQYVQQPMAAPPVQQPVAAPVAARRVVSRQVQEIGPGQFDPDPETSVEEVISEPQRVTVRGPYGPGGTQETVTGIYRPPAQRIYTTLDIPNHPVVNNGFAAPTNQMMYPSM
jgi:hypothetical protein